MGGTGTARIALRYPDRFAAAEPLCGYHSYFIRRDISLRRCSLGKAAGSEKRSNSLWAENGLYLPLYVWHGKRDLPEKNSGVLIERDTALGYAVEHEHPDVGHDVWKRAYDGAAAISLALREEPDPRASLQIVFKTDSPRYLDDAWVHLREIVDRALDFATIEAEVSRQGGEIDDEHPGGRGARARPQSRAASQLRGRPRCRRRDALTFARGHPHRRATKSNGRVEHRSEAGQRRGTKRAGLSGPMRDAFFEPLVFVYGTQDPEQTRANRETARAWARIRGGVEARYPSSPTPISTSKWPRRTRWC